MKAQNVYVPVSVIVVAVVLMLLQAVFLPVHSGDNQLHNVMIASAKIGFYIPVLLAGMVLAGIFGYPLAPAHWCGLQLLATTLGPAALRNAVGYVAGDFVGMIVGLGLFLGLIGYFFSEEAMDALIAIFLVVAAHAVVTSLLMPLFMMFLA
jgi:hypothetical protein